MMRRILLGMCFVLIPVALLAHDTWLVATSYYLVPGTAVEVRLATSEAFPTSEAAASPDRIARFTMRTASGVTQVTGAKAAGKFLVAEVKPSQPGPAVVVLETKSRAFVLEPKIFNQYISEEGHQHVLDARAAKGLTNSPGRERYRKITKAILCVGDGKDLIDTLPEGLWLEVVPEKNSCGLKVGDSLTVRVLFEGRPLAGGHVAAGYEGPTGHKYPVWTPTDAQGRATLKFDRAGVWFVRAHHIVARTSDPEADWESAFSTLTFEVLK